MGSLRDTLSSVIDGASPTEGAGDGGAGASDDGGGVHVESGGPGVLEAADQSAPAAREGEDSGGDGRAVGQAERARDSAGKFAKGGPKAPTEAQRVAAPSATPIPKAAEATQTAAPVPGEPTAAIKPPQSWKPAAREHWTKLPAEVQQEINRREGEVTLSLSQHIENKQFRDQFKEAVAPFEGMLRAEGSDPIRAVGELLQVAQALRTAPAGHKAQIVANMVKSFGIPIDALAAAIDGEAQPQTQHAQQMDPRQMMAQLKQELLGDFQRQSQEQATQKAQQELASFAEGHEFFDTVREMMGGLFQAKVARNYEDAYSQACKLHPDVAPVIAQREATKAATAQNAATQRSRDASSSVKTRPAGFQNGAKPNSVRSTLEAVIGDLSGR